LNTPSAPAFLCDILYRYNVLEAAALVIKNASSCTMSPCDFESANYNTVACVHHSAESILKHFSLMFCAATPLLLLVSPHPPRNFGRAASKARRCDHRPMLLLLLLLLLLLFLLLLLY
jgi:hypothetical protein